MYDELDIFEKECSNDQFRFECMIECMCMDAEMSSDGYMTEAEGFLDKIKNKVKEITDKIITTFKTSMGKISAFFTSKKVEAKYKMLLDRAKDLEKRLKTAKVDASRLASAFDDCVVYDYNLAEEKKTHIRLSDRIIALAKNVSGKVKDGEKVTATDIRDIRQEALDLWAREGWNNSKESKAAKHIYKMDKLVQTLATGATHALIGALLSAGSGSQSTTTVLGMALNGLIITSVENHFTKKHAKERSELLKNAQAASGDQAPVQVIATQMAALTAVVENAETMSYKNAISYLNKNLSAIEKTLNKVEAAIKSAEASNH